MALLLSSALTIYGQKNAPLSLWNATAQKEAILDFVAAVCDEEGKDFVPVAERLAVFDFDGTVGCEKPDYMEVIVAVNQLCNSAQQNPALLRDPLYKAACDQQLDYINDNVWEAILTAFLNYPQSDYVDSVATFISTHSHPKFNLLYSKTYYAPMLQLIRYLRAHDFKVYLCSGSEQGFVRSYGVNHLGFSPAETIGSTVSLSYDSLGPGDYALTRTNAFLNPEPEHSGKAILIRNRIGIQPILAFGNSSGDLEMLSYTQSNQHRNLELILIHNDSREYVYEHKEFQQRAKEEGWQLVPMKENFKRIFPK